MPQFYYIKPDLFKQIWRCGCMHCRLRTYLFKKMDQIDKNWELFCWVLNFLYFCVRKLTDFEESLKYLYIQQSPIKKIQKLQKATATQISSNRKR